MKLLSSTIFSSLHDLWLLWNSQLHDANGRSLHSYHHSQLLHEIEALYDLAPSMLASDGAVFHYLFAKRQTHKTNQLRDFLSFARPVVLTSMEQAKDMGSNFKTVDKYLCPIIPQHVIDAILGNFSCDPDSEMKQIRPSTLLSIWRIFPPWEYIALLAVCRAAASSRNLCGPVRFT
jgi:hypothetical protein